MSLIRLTRQQRLRDVALAFLVAIIILVPDQTLFLEGIREEVQVKIFIGLTLCSR